MRCTILLATMLGIVAAQTVRNENVNNNINCPGVARQTGNNKGYCCIGGELNLSNCDGWPICRGPTSFDPASTTLACATTVALDDSDYEERVKKASADYLDDKGSITKYAKGWEDKATQAAGRKAAAVTETAATASTSEAAAPNAAAPLLGPAWGGLFAFANMY